MQINGMFGSYSYLYFQGDTTLQGGGTVTLNEVVANGPGTLTNVNNTIQGYGVLGDLVNQAGGTINANVAGQGFALTNTNSNAGLMEATDGGTLYLQSGATLNNNSGGTIFTDAISMFQNQGTLTNTGAFNNSGSVTNTGNFQVGSGGVVNNMGSLGNVQGGGFTVQASGTLNNSGFFSVDYLSGLGSLAGSTIVNTSTGTMSLAGNTINIEGTLRNNGTITLMPGPIDPITLIQQPAPPLLIASSGTLTGTGTVNAGVGGFASVIVNGVMAPGDPGGAFTINGNYVQNAGGTLDIRLGGTGAGQFGVLNVTSNADLDGTVDFTAINGFDPTAGDDFTFLLFGTMSGSFANIEFTNWICPVGDTCMDVVGANSITLEISGGTGSGGGGGGGSTSTPEPSSLALLMSAGVLLLSFARKRGMAAAQ